MGTANEQRQDGRMCVSSELSRRAFVVGAAAFAASALAGCSGSASESGGSLSLYDQLKSKLSSSFDSEEGIAEVIGSMTLEQKIAQLFVVHPEQLVDVDAVIQAGDATEQALIANPVAGVVYESKNIVDSTQFTELVAGFYEMCLQASALPPLLLSGEEGGAFAPMANARALGLDVVPAAREIGADGGAVKAEDVAAQVGRYLAGFGFNGTLAPVCNLASGKGSLMDKRCFSEDADVVSQCAEAQIRMYSNMKTISCAKYFPFADVDFDEGRYKDLTPESFEQNELSAFQAAVDAGVPMVMMGKAAVPQLQENEEPAVFSPLMVNDMLRDQLGFEGVVSTCELYSLSADGEHSEEEIGVMALQAGCDLLMLPANYHAMYEGILAAVEAGELTEERIAESALRIARLKMNYLSF